MFNRLKSFLKSKYNSYMIKNIVKGNLGIDVDGDIAYITSRNGKVIKKYYVHCLGNIVEEVK